MRSIHPPFLPSSTRARLSIAVVVVVAAMAASVLRAPASAAATPTLSSAAVTPHSVLQPVTLFAVRGGGFRSRPRINPSTRNRPVARRNPNTGRAVRSFSRAILRALGIAFLLSFLFGIGPGGSPLGLLLLLGIIALVVVSRRRRRQYSYR